MNPLDLYAVPDPEFTEDQMDAARERLIAALVEDGWTRDEADKRIDDLLVIEQCEADRQDRAATRADEDRARRKETW